MVTPTDLGTVAEKASNTVFVLPNITVQKGSSLDVAIGYEYTGGATIVSVTHGNRSLHRRLQRSDAGVDRTLNVWIKGTYKKTITGDVVITFSAPVGLKVVAASAWDRLQRVDVKQGKIESANTTQPGTGQTDLLCVNNGLAVCYFVCKGPIGDAPGDPRIEDLDLWQSVSVFQRDGTAGGGPLNNITLTKTYLNLTGNNTTRGQLQNAGNRQWVNGIVCLKEATYSEFFCGTYAEHLENLLAASAIDGPRAWTLLGFAQINEWSLPETPPQDMLDEVNMTLAEWQAGRSLLASQNVATLEADQTITPKGLIY